MVDKKQQTICEFFEKILDKIEKVVIMVLSVVLIHQEKEVKCMTNTELLEYYIKRSGLKKGHLAEKVGLSRQGLNNCLKNPSTFRASQVGILCDALGIEDHHREPIFFANDGA